MSQHVQRHVTEASDTRPCPSCTYQVFIGIAIAVVGFALMLTGALAAVGIVVLTIGVLYAGIAWAISLLPASKFDPDQVP